MSKALDTKLKRLTWICRKPQDGKRTNSYKLSFDFHKHAVADEHTHTPLHKHMPYPAINNKFKKSFGLGRWLCR